METLDWVLLTVSIAIGTWASRFMPNLVSKAIKLLQDGAAKVAKLSDEEEA